MKKVVVFIALFLCIISIVSLTGCDKKTYNFYFDELDINIEGINFVFNCSEYTNQNTKLTINLKVKNTQTNDKSFSLNNIKVVNEKTKVAYNAVINLFGSTTLQYDIINEFTITSTIASSYRVDNYYLSFKFNDKYYNVKLYEMPDELRKEYTISFRVYTYPDYIIANTSTIKENRTGKNYIWEDPNHLYFCDTWYIDEERTISFNWNTKIKHDYTLYGINKPNLKTSYDGGTTYINGINYVPQDGILVINKSFGKISISNYGIYNNSSVKEIYLPGDIKRIYFGNFTKMNNLQKIHFAGSEEKWNSIESSTNMPENVNLIFNSSFYN